MARRELIDVATGRRYIETATRGTRRPHSVAGRETRQRLPARSHPDSSAQVGRIGLLLLCSGAFGLFCVLYTHAEHLEALLVCITCLGAMLLGVCTMGLRSLEPRLRRS